MRLEKERYFAVQTIYYPGFTIAGACEPLAAIAALVLLVTMQFGSVAFWLTLLAVVGLVSMHIVYWIAVHPVNKLWLHGERLTRAGSRFFSLASASGTDLQDWRRARSHWEYAHAWRAVLAAGSFVMLVVATVIAAD